MGVCETLAQVGAKWLPLKVFQAIKWAYQGKIDLARSV